MMPLVSICIPTFNGARFIAQALESILAQTYSQLEIVVSDDNSHDKTVQIIEAFKARTNIPLYIYHHQPQGIGANWNHCIGKANGEYIKFLFQDDTLDSECIDKMMSIAIKNPNVGLVYCKRHFLIDDKTSEINRFIECYGNLNTYWENQDLPQRICSGKIYLKDKELLNSPKNKIGEPTTILIKKECIKKVGLFNEELKQTLDYEYWYRVMKTYDVAFIDEKLAGFRLHSKQASQVNKDNDINSKETKMLYKAYYKHIFWQLHPKNKLKLLKLYHPLLKCFVKLKQRINA